MVGGVLVHVCGLDGFLANRKRLESRVDRETTDWRTFVEAWWGQLKDQAVAVSGLLELASKQELLPTVLSGDTERSRRSRLAKALSRNTERVFGGYLIGVGPLDRSAKRKTYQLQPIGGVVSTIRTEIVQNSTSGESTAQEEEND